MGPQHHPPRSLRLCTFLVVIVLGFTPSAFGGAKVVVAYVPNWINLKSFAETIDYSKVTHINIAFENAVNDDGDLSFSKQNDLLIAKAHEHKLKVLVSLGGGSAATDKTLLKRYELLLSDKKRASFVEKITAYISKHSLDGFDVDLEGPGINDHYGAFIADLAKAIKLNGLLLTAALSMEYGGKSVPESVFADFDFVNIMAYDGSGPWDPKSPGPHSSMAYAKRNIDYWIKRGLPKSKAVLGIPFYGYGFGDAARKHAYTYAQIVTEFPGAENADEAGKTIWYNGVPTVRAKSKYVIDDGLAGIMIWSLDNDAKGDKSLLKAIHQALSETSASETK